MSISDRPATYLYGIITTIAFIVSFFLFVYNSKGFISYKNLIKMYLTVVVFSIAGARILYIFVYPSWFNNFYDYIAIHRGGLIFYGGFVGGIIAVTVFCWLKKIQLLAMLDLSAPSMAVGHAIGRVGCLTNHCCYGRVTELIRVYQIRFEPDHMYRHPTQLYEIIFLVFLLLILQKKLSNILKKRNSKSFLNGKIAAIYMLSYSFYRFNLEFLRGDDRGAAYLFMSISQLISVLIFSITSFALLIKYWNKKNETNLES